MKRTVFSLVLLLIICLGIAGCGGTEINGDQNSLETAIGRELETEDVQIFAQKDTDLAKVVGFYADGKISAAVFQKAENGYTLWKVWKPGKMVQRGSGIYVTSAYLTNEDGSIREDLFLAVSENDKLKAFTYEIVGGEKIHMDLSDCPALLVLDIGKMEGAEGSFSSKYSFLQEDGTEIQ